jgi:hypothetical protein
MVGGGWWCGNGNGLMLVGQRREQTRNSRRKLVK